MKSLYIGASRYDAARVGFDDQYIYDVINKTADHQQVHIENVDCEACQKPLDEWQEKVDKTRY
jgi:guanine deaminase